MVTKMETDKMIVLSEINKRAEQYEESKYWLEKASDEGSIPATESIAIQYLNGSKMYEKDVDKAVQYFEKAALAGSSDAMVFLGLSSIIGIGVKENIGTGVFWLVEAQKAGNESAKEVLDLIYKVDEDVQED